MIEKYNEASPFHANILDYEIVDNKVTVVFAGNVVYDLIKDSTFKSVEYFQKWLNDHTEYWNSVEGEVHKFDYAKTRYIGGNTYLLPKLEGHYDRNNKASNIYIRKNKKKRGNPKRVKKHQE